MLTVKLASNKLNDTSPPTGKCLLPEQRRKFTLEFGKKFNDKDMDATATTKGDFHTSILIRGNIFNELLVLEMTRNAEGKKDLRDMGFKHLIVTDGRTAWDIDLKN